jgi:hypothetical protein
MSDDHVNIFAKALEEGRLAWQRMSEAEKLLRREFFPQLSVTEPITAARLRKQIDDNKLRDLLNVLERAYRELGYNIYACVRDGKLDVKIINGQLIDYAISDEDFLDYMRDLKEHCDEHLRIE